LVKGGAVVARRALKSVEKRDDESRKPFLYVELGEWVDR
jgi:hypothetical protein